MTMLRPLVGLLQALDVYNHRVATVKAMEDGGSGGAGSAGDAATVRGRVWWACWAARTGDDDDRGFKGGAVRMRVFFVRLGITCRPELLAYECHVSLVLVATRNI